MVVPKIFDERYKPIKIYIVGSVASGKTTVARRLSQRLALPWYELDCIVHCDSEAGRCKRTPEQQAQVIGDIDRQGGWIIEGTYRESCHCLLEKANKIIFLDMPLWKRRLRIFTRFARQQLGIEKCHYKSDIKMLKMMYRWTNDFEKNRVEFEKMLREYGNKLVVINNGKEFYHLI